MEYCADEEYTPSEFELKINALIEEQVNNQVGNIKEELIKKNALINRLTTERDKLKKENKDLIDINKQIESFKVFKNLVDENNFENFLYQFNLKKDNIDFNGMHSDELPKWFKWLIYFYEDRETLFMLMDMFDIKYPPIMKLIKMPYDYDENELDIIFSKLSKLYVCNGCIFENNIGFWHSEFKSHQYDFNKLMKNASYVDIPWQLLLKNKLLTTDKYFNKIINAIKKKESNSNYFYTIQKYQTISNEQALELAKLLPKNKLYETHKKFIEMNNKIIKNNIWLAEYFSEVINDNQFSTFYYLNYPLEMQKEYIRKYKNSYYDKLDLIKKMEISKVEKLKFLQEFAEQELE